MTVSTLIGLFLVEAAASALSINTAELGELHRADTDARLSAALLRKVITEYTSNKGEQRLICTQY